MALETKILIIESCPITNFFSCFFVFFTPLLGTKGKDTELVIPVQKVRQAHTDTELVIPIYAQRFH